MVEKIRTSNPYVGPRPFGREDTHIFFGRKSEIEALQALVAAYPIVLLYAHSGVGKSSLLNAGLLPYLETEAIDLFEPVRVSVATDIHAAHDIDNIFAFSVITSWAQTRPVASELTKMTLAEYLRSIARPLDNFEVPLPRVVIFDQFEEIFFTHEYRWVDRKAFFEQLKTALNEDARLTVILSMREDYLAELDPYRSYIDIPLQARVRIDRLRHEAALQAIVEPLKYTSRHFAEGAAEKLATELGNAPLETQSGIVKTIRTEFIEPVILQVVCENLWTNLNNEQRNIAEITADYIDKNVRIDNALVQYYEERVIKDVTSKVRSISEETLRRWFDEVLITPIGTRGIVYRNPNSKSTGGLPDSAVQVLQDRHIIRGEERANARWYELSHDRFIKPIKDANEQYRLKHVSENNQRVERPAASNALLSAWRHFLDYDFVSSNQKRAYSRLREIQIALFLLIISGSVISFYLQNVIYNGYGFYIDILSPLSFLLRILLVIMPIAYLTLSSYAQQQVNNFSWIISRMAAEKIRSEIYLYRMRSAHYYNLSSLERDQVILRKVENVRQFASRLINHTPRNYDDIASQISMRTETPVKDDGLSALVLENYVDWHVRPQLQWYNQKIIRDYSTVQRERSLSIAVVALGGVLAAINFEPLVAITMVMSLTLDSRTETRTYGATYHIFSKTAVELQKKVDEWQLRTDISDEEISQVVEGFENIFNQERIEWAIEATRLSANNSGDMKNRNIAIDEIPKLDEI